MATAIPSTVVSTANLDAGTDSAASARSDIYDLTIAYNQLIAAIGGGAVVYSDLNDGVNSGLDAATLDAQAADYYQNSGNQNAGTLPLARLPATLTGKDADTVDGQHGAYYRDASNLNAGTVPEARLTEGSATAKGIVELATTAEMSTGTSTTLVPPVKEIVDYADANYAPIVSRTWTDVSGSRVFGVTYTNTTGHDIQLSIVGSVNGTSQRGAVSVYADGVRIGHDTTSDRNPNGSYSDAYNTQCQIIPHGVGYELLGNDGVITSWWELR